MFLRDADVHSKVTRHGHINVVCPRSKRENEGERSFTISDIKSWNSLPHELRKNNSSVLKTHLRKYNAVDNFTKTF